MAQAGYTPIQLYHSTTASAVPSAGNLANGEPALNITDGKLYYKNNSGVVTLLASADGASGNVVGPASSTDNALVRFDTTTGKLVQNSVGILDDSGNLTGIAALTTSGALTLNGGTANGVAYLNGSKVLTTGSALTFDGTTLSNSTSGTPFSLNRTGAATALIELKQSGTVGSYLGTSGSNDMIFFSGAAAELMRLTSTGLGIGTSSPATKLHVNSGAAGYAITVAALAQTGRTYQLGIDANNSLAFYDTTAAAQRLVLDSSGNLGLGVTPSGHLPAGYGGPMLQVGGRASILGSATTSAYTNNTYYASGFFRYIGNDEATMLEQIDGAFKFYTAPSGTAGNAISFTQAMTLDASGNLALGLTSASTRLHVRAATDAANVLQIQDASVAQTLNFGVNNINGGPYVFVSTNHALRFGTNDTERARIDSSGNLLVGVTPVVASALGGGRLVVQAESANFAGTFYQTATSSSAYAMRVRHDNSTSGAYIQFVTDTNIETGRIYDSAGTMQYASSSDARLKTNIQPIQNGLSSVLALKPCTFDMRRGESIFIPSAGLIAQEVHEVYPFAVGVGGDDENTNPWSVDYGKLTPLLIKAIQELKAEFDAYKASHP
jgi:hypothetical protein